MIVWLAGWVDFWTNSRTQGKGELFKCDTKCISKKCKYIYLRVKITKIVLTCFINVHNYTFPFLKLMQYSEDKLPKHSYILIDGIVSES